MFLDFVHRPMFSQNTTFRKLDLFPSSVKIKVPCSVGSLRASLITAPVTGASSILPEDGSRSSFFLRKYWTMEKSPKTCFFQVQHHSQSPLTNSVAQEPEGSSPHSQQPATGPCRETVESNPHPPSQSP
jgi:hypothetical protein